MKQEMKQEFNWGNVNSNNFLSKEILELNCYEHIHPVKKGDIVLDLGASIGLFTWKIMDKASKVYTVEPMIDLIPTIKKNTNSFPVNIINRALSYENGEIEFTDDCIDDFEPKLVKTVDFQTLLKENNIDKIDYIKTDCEGGEYALINDSNIKWIKQNVRNIVGEWHLGEYKGVNLTTKFRHFRDKYLPQFKNYEVYSVNKVNIKWDLQNEHFMEYYKQVIIHIEV